MARRGRKPEPTAALRLVGSRQLSRRRPGPGVEGIPPPRCPAWISSGAKREWAAIVPMLIERGIVCGLDTALLSVFCQTFADYRAAVEELHKSGETITTKAGRVVAHPAVRRMNQSREMLRKLASELWLSPASRPAGPRRRAPDDPLGDFTNRRGGPA